MNILFIGDIMGRAGRNVIKSHLKEIQSEYQIDFTIANAEKRLRLCRIGQIQL